MFAESQKRKLEALITQAPDKIDEFGNLDLRQLAELHHLETVLVPRVAALSPENLDARVNACSEIYAYDDECDMAKAYAGDLHLSVAEPIGRFAFTDEMGVAKRTSDIAKIVRSLTRLRDRPALAERIVEARDPEPNRPNQTPVEVQAILLAERRAELDAQPDRSAARRRFLASHLLSGFRSRFPKLYGDTARKLAAAAARLRVDLDTEIAEMTAWDVLEGLSSRWEFVAAAAAPEPRLDTPMGVAGLAAFASDLAEGNRASIDIALSIGTLRAHLRAHLRARDQPDSFSVLLE